MKGFTHIKTVKDIEEYEFKKNGLRVLFMHVPGSGSVTANIVYRVGSRHEERGKTGLAHLLEHMMFKPTRDRKGQRVDPPRHTALQNQGAILNATTWNDRTNYYFTMPKAYLGDMLLCESERMRGLILTDKEFAPERQNVLSEYEMVTERPEVALDSAMVGVAFISHGYGHDTIGHRPDIASVSAQDLKDFYDIYYWPNNATLVVVGDVTRTEMLKEVTKHFSHIRRSPHDIPVGSFEEPTQEGPRTVAVTRPNPLSIVSVSYRGPRGISPAWVHAHILLSHLAGGKLSMLYKRLVETQKASSISPSLPPSYDAHLLGISGTAVKGVPLQVLEKAIKRAIEDVRGTGISQKDLKRIKEKITADLLYRRDGTHTIAQELTEYIAMGDWELYYKILKDVEDTTPADINAVLKTYIKENHEVVGTFIGTTVSEDQTASV